MGIMTIDGQAIENLPIHQRSRMGLSYLPQEASIFRKLNVSENIQAVLELQIDEKGQPLTPSVIQERLQQLLQELSYKKPDAEIH